jgi:hypothetical protein
VGGTTGGISVGSQSVVEDGSWHHLAMTWQKDTPAGFCSYLDGVLVASRSSANADLPAFSNTTSYLGCYNGSSEFLNGQMDEIRVWSVARTQLEISTNMCLKLNPASETSLVAYYNCDGVAGSSHLSEIKNTYTGTLTDCDTSAAWVPSAVPMGDSGNLLWTTTPSQVGAAGQSCLVILNYSEQPQNLTFDLGTSAARLVFSSHPRDTAVNLTEIDLHEGGHIINGVKSYPFLHKHLDWPEP